MKIKQAYRGPFLWLMDVRMSIKLYLCLYVSHGKRVSWISYTPRALNSTILTLHYTFLKTQTSSKKISSSETGTAKQKSSSIKVKICLLKDAVFI